MSTIVIVGSASALSLAIARVFGQKGFSVALVSRSQARLDSLAERLAGEGVQARGFAADITDKPSVEAVFSAIADRFGEIEILEFSPAPRVPVQAAGSADALHLSMESVRPRMEFLLGGAINVVGQVLTTMLDRDSGTLIFTTNLSSVHPSPMPADVGIAGAALRNWAHALNVALSDTNVHVAHVAVGVPIAGGDADATSLAPLYWDIYTARDQVELLCT